jgi:glycosidase
MIDQMIYWLQQEGVDGFRCDVASFVPVDFWQQAIPKLRAEKPIFMLAESDDPALLAPGLFDAAYGWASHHLINDIAGYKNNAASYNWHITEQFKKYGDKGVLMNFVENHDENSWNGTFFSRAGNNWEAMLVLSYAAPGMPLIYSGLEYDLNHSLKFFEKDNIPKEKGRVWPVLEKLSAIKRNLTALHGSKDAAGFQLIETNQREAVIAFKRFKEASELVYLANFSNAVVHVNVQHTGTYANAMNQALVQLDPEATIELAAGDYLVLVKRN